MDATLILEVAIGYCLGAFIVGFVKGLRPALKARPPRGRQTIGCYESGDTPANRMTDPPRGPAPGAPPNPGRVTRH